MSSSIDSILYRPLKHGKEYNALIPLYKGIDHNFDNKSDNSDTYDTLKYMAEWANKYASQMAKIAPILKGRSLQETVNNIYQFLYSHFQYRLDGETQNLYSPSAAWHFREKGFDCKTYSILASTILQNLRIPHAFRMVQQAGIMPGEWSHVYVVIPNGSSHYIIDATTHNNKEVSFTNKYDYNMKHKGLASPYVSGLGCACQGTPIRSTGLGAPSVMANTVNNFHVFLNELEKKGVPRQVTNKMLALVKWNIENGIDPNMGEILKKAYSQSGLGLTAVGSTYGGITAGSLPTGNVYAPTATSSFGSQALSSGTSALNNLSVGGISVGGLATDLATGNFIGAGLSVLTSIIPIEKTFGAVFANSFDLSCWGASYSEQKAKADLLIWLPFLRDWSGIYKSPTTENLDRFQFATQSMLNDAANGQNSKYASCTRKGWALVQKGVEELRKNTYEEFTSQNFQLTSQGQRSGANWVIKLPNKSDNYGWANPQVSFESFRVTPPAPVKPQTPTQTTTVVDANGNPVATTEPKEKSSSALPIIAIGGAILTGIKLLM
ncbi:hypothetical protein SAMN05443667_101258 [Flavobacterium gillisiae]|uniref:Transglutaminase-like superfamily protein n=1 Tax=Flavobacterium gillisiae TaxID=150146 RepID=A0A1H3WVE7_9FLAO|nr:hypothetical protein [Flavobacterium gillisiae]SDZ91093.1 hypothetical protein SAMN05443667_101258 [Flavobacterium gillisiae]